jgi:hypothetical protein
MVNRILDALNVGQMTGLENHIGAAGNGAVSYGKGVVHVITGHTKRNIQVQTVNQLAVKVLSKAIYSGHENARGPPHDFFDQMYNWTRQTYSGQVAIGAIQKVVREKVLLSTGLRPS